MLAKSTDYGLTVSDESLIRVANTPDTQFLLQAELRAIQQGLQYIEDDNKYGKYKGYVNKDGQLEGVGVLYTDGIPVFSEFHLNNLHGVAKVEAADGNIHWGEFKDGNQEGYGTYEYPNGDRYIGQCSNDNYHGYGIYRWAHGAVYYGEYKESNRDGQGYLRVANGNGYWGEWKNHMKWGQGV